MNKEKLFKNRTLDSDKTKVRSPSTEARLIGLIAAFFVVVAFQNCSGNVGFSGGKQASLNGGVGSDGMALYLSLGTCSGNPGITNKLQVMANRSLVQALRLNCIDLATPQTIDSTQVSYAIGDTTVLVWNNTVFDQVPTDPNAPQKITINYCQSSSGTTPFSVSIWKTAANDTIAFGEVNNSQGSLTGPEQVSYIASSETYTSVPGSSVPFDISIAAGILDYTISGVQHTAEGITCYPLAPSPNPTPTPSPSPTPSPTPTPSPHSTPSPTPTPTPSSSPFVRGTTFSWIVSGTSCATKQCGTVQSQLVICADTSGNIDPTGSACAGQTQPASTVQCDPCATDTYSLPTMGGAGRSSNPTANTQSF